MTEAECWLTFHRYAAGFGQPTPPNERLVVPQLSLEGIIESLPIGPENDAGYYTIPDESAYLVRVDSQTGEVIYD